MAACLVLLACLSAAWSIGDIMQAGSMLPAPLRKPANEMRSAMANLPANEEGIDLERTSRLITLLRTAPLASEPFTIKAYDLVLRGSLSEAEPLVAIALKRNPRSREARLLAVDAKLANANIAAAVQDLEVLTRLMPSQRALFDQSLVALASFPETREATLTAIRDDATKRVILVGLGRVGADPSTIIDAWQSMSAQGLFVEDSSTIRTITQPMIDAGDYTGSYRVWSALTQRERKPAALVRDSTFDQKVPPPFGWRLASGPDGFIAAGADGLKGEAYGRRSAMLAEQLLVLEAGSYRLVLNIAEPSNLATIVLKCAPDRQLIVQRLEPAGQMVRAFEVPAECAGQSFSVNARASDPPRSGTFRVRSINIVRGNR